MGQSLQKNTKSPHYYRSAGFTCLLQAKTLVETINTSTGVNQLLLAGIERVALGADFDSDVLLGGTSSKDIAASAADGSLIVLGMETFLHCCSPLSSHVKGHRNPNNLLLPAYHSIPFKEMQAFFSLFSRIILILAFFLPKQVSAGVP